MTNDDVGHILAGGAGTITVTSDAGLNVYPNQGFYILATVTMGGGNNIPTGAMVDFSTSTGINILFGEPHAGSVPIVSADGITGTARLCVRHDEADSTNSIHVNAKAGPGWEGAAKPDDAPGVDFTVLSSKPTIACLGATKTLMSVPTATDGDRLTPASDSFTTKFSCQVVDASGQPVPGYVVEWHEAASKSLSLFTGLVNAYTSASAAFGDKLPSSDAVFIDDTNEGKFIRMATDAQGLAELYLVAKHRPGPISTAVRATYDFSVDFEYPRPFIVADIHKASAYWEECKPELADKVTDGVLDYQELLHPPFVTVTISGAYPQSHSDDQIYLVLNQAIVAGPYAYSDDLRAQFLANLANSGPENENNMTFIVVRKGSGVPNISDTTGFYGTGNNLQLPGGTLDQAKLEPPGGAISQTTLNLGPVMIKIELAQSTHKFTAVNNDVITATAVLTGYDVDGGPRDPVAVPATAIPPLGDTDIGDGYVYLTFPIEPFTEWGREPYGNEDQSQCCIIYTVQRNGSTLATSQLLELTMDTGGVSY